MAINKRPLCYPRTPFKGGTPAPKGDVKAGRLSTMLNYVDGKIKKYNDPFVPIHDLDRYVSGLRKDGRSDEYIKEVVEKHEKYYEENPPATCTKTEEPVISNIIDEFNPLKELLRKDITVEEIIEVYRKAGYSDEFIQRITTKYEKYKDAVESANEYLDTVMSMYSGKPPARKKKVSVRARMTTMYRNKNLIKAEDVDNTSENVDEDM